MVRLRVVAARAAGGLQGVRIEVRSSLRLEVMWHSSGLCISFVALAFIV